MFVSRKRYNEMKDIAEHAVEAHERANQDMQDMATALADLRSQVCVVGDQAFFKAQLEQALEDMALSGQLDQTLSAHDIKRKPERPQ